MRRSRVRGWMVVLMGLGLLLAMTPVGAEEHMEVAFVSGGRTVLGYAELIDPSTGGNAGSFSFAVIIQPTLARASSEDDADTQRPFAWFEGYYGWAVSGPLDPGDVSMDTEEISLRIDLGARGVADIQVRIDAGWMEPVRGAYRFRCRQVTSQPTTRHRLWANLVAAGSATVTGTVGALEVEEESFFPRAWIAEAGQITRIDDHPGSCSQV